MRAIANLASLTTLTAVAMTHAAAPPTQWVMTILPMEAIAAIPLPLEPTVAPRPVVIPPRVTCPDRMALIGSVCIDRYEAHLVFTSRGRTVLHPHYERPHAKISYRARSKEGVAPQGYLSRDEASAACTNAGKRLCTYEEWTGACRDVKPASCNVGKEHLLSKKFGTNPKHWHRDRVLNAPELAREPGFLARCGAHPDCRTSEGVFDLVGNLHEWVSTPATAERVAAIDRQPIRRIEQPWQRGNGLFLGGFFSISGELGRGCNYVTYAHQPEYHDYSTGFRCCATPVIDSGERIARALTRRVQTDEPSSPATGPEWRQASTVQ